MRGVVIAALGVIGSSALVTATARADAQCKATAAVAEPVQLGISLSDGKYIGDNVTDIAASPDGRYLATTTFEGNLAVWDAASGVLLQRVAAGYRFGARWSSDGTALWIPDVSRPTTVHVDVGSGAVTTATGARFPLPGRADADTLAVTGTTLELRRGTAVVGTLAWPSTAQAIARVVIASDGASIAAVTDAPDTRTLTIWTRDDRGREVVLPGPIIEVVLVPGGVEALVSYDVGAGDEVSRALARIDLATGTTLELPELAGAGMLAVSADGRLVAYMSARDGVAVRELAGLALRWRQPLFGLFASGIDAIAFDAAGTTLVVGGRGPTKRLDLDTGAVASTLGLEISSLTARFLDDGHLITGDHAHLTTWNLTTGAPVPARSLTLANHGWQIDRKDLVVDRSTRAVLYGCYTPHYLDRWKAGTPPADLDDAIADEVPSGSTIAKEAPAWPPQGAARVPACVPDGFWLDDLDLASGRAVVGQAGDLAARTLLDLRTGAMTVLAMSAKAWGVEAWLDGDVVLAERYEGDGADSVKVVSAWNAAGERADYALPPLSGNDPTGRRLPIARSADGKWLAVGSDPFVSVFDAATATESMRVRLDAAPESIAFVGRDLLVSVNDGTLRRLAEDGTERARATGGGGAVTISPDQHRFLAEGPDRLVQLWDLDAMRLVVSFGETPDGEWFTVSPGGAFHGSPDAGAMFSLRFAGPSAMPLGAYEATFRDPGIIKARLAGKDRDVSATAVRPPRLAMNAPTLAADGTATIVAQIDSTIGAGEVRAFVEGREVGSASYCGAHDELELSVPVVASASRVTLIAFDRGAGSSFPASFDLPTATEDPPDLWAVVVGVGAYPRLGARWQLGADRDARALAGLFEDMGDGRAYREAHVTLLVDGEVTTASVRAALAGLKGMAPRDLAIVYFAGHGWRTSGGDMVLLTSKTKDLRSAAKTGISWTSLRDQLEAIPGRALVLLDACHAGVFSRDVVVPNEQLADELARTGRSGVVVFAASKGRQFSYETGNTRGHFELAVTEAAVKRRKIARKPKEPEEPEPPVEPAPLQAAGEISEDTPTGLYTVATIQTFLDPHADINGDGWIQLSELSSSVSRRVRAGSRDAQTPMLSRVELFGDFAVGPVMQ